MTEQTNPSQIASLAKQLVTSDHVVGMVGNSSIIECSVDAAYWKSVGIDVLGAGIAPECYSTPNTASVNMGPRYSSDGAVQYVLAQGASKIAFDQSNVPGTDYIAAGPNAIAKAKDVPIQDFTENVPITSANAIATKLVTAGGPERRGGAQLHPARGAADPAGRAEAQPGGPGQVLGLLHPVQHRLPGDLARPEVERQAVRQRRAAPA